MCHTMPVDPVRIAEPWTVGSVIGALVLGVAVVALVVWVVRKAARS